MKNILSIMFVLAFMCLKGSLLIAQTNFIEQITKPSHLENITRTPIFNSLEQDARNLSVVPVQLNDLWDFQEMGILSFDLPGIQQTLRAKTTRPRRYANNDYTWTGQLLSAQEEVIGDVSFIRKGNKNFGRITLVDRHFIIQDLNLPYAYDQVLIEMDQHYLLDNNCGVSDIVENTNNGPVPGNGGPGQAGPGGGGGGGDCQAFITILILYTQEVIDEGSDPEQLALRGIVDLNNTLAESAIPGANVSASIAAVELLEDYTEVGNADNAINDLAMNANILPLRDEHNADLVILFQTTDLFTLREVNGNLVLRDIAGIANINGVEEGVLPDSSRVFSVIETSASALTFVHEVGHLLGCRHLKEDDHHEYANAYGEVCINPIQVNGETQCNVLKSTVMNGRGDGTRILRFSNPNVEYQGGVTGTSDHFNAQMIGLSACPISLFGGLIEGAFPDPPFNVFASGPTNVYHDNQASFNYSSYHLGCLDGFECYHWEISWDYENTFQHLSFTEDAVLDGADVPANVPDGFIRVTAFCTEEPDTSEYIIQIKNWSAENLSAWPDDLRRTADLNRKQAERTDSDLILHAAKEVSIYPNPAKDLLHIELKAVPDTSVEIRLVDAKGVTQLVYYGEGSKINLVDTSSLPSGFYTVEIKIAEKYLREPLIINH